MKYASEALAEVGREYEAHPEGWRVYAGIDSSQLPTLYIFHNEYAWTIKYPRFGMNGLADKVKIEEDKLVQAISKDPQSYGLRIIEPFSFQTLMHRMHKGTLSDAQKQAFKPISAKEVNERKPRSCLDGPYIESANSPIAPISQSQVDLEIKLREEIKRLTDGMYL